MRKDVKIGLAVGGILLVVLIGYVLKVPSDKQNPDLENGQGATLAQPEIVIAPPATQPAPVAAGASVPATQPVVVGPDPFATHPAGVTGSEVSVTPTTPAKGQYDWGAVLQTGTLSAVGPMDSREKATTVVALQNPTRPTTPIMTIAPTTRPAGGRSHTVQPGETLSSIAQAAYGDASLYPAILKANPKINPNKLRAGSVIVLPDSTTASADRKAAVAAPVAKTIDASREYRVQPGDSLEKIALKLYGSADKWQKLYDANKDRIGSDPHKIKSDMVLALPEAPTR